MSRILGRVMTLLFAFVMFFLANRALTMFVDGEPHTHEVRYDCCALHGGWHPDVPIEVQNKCREKK